jgi:hypothetical protein
MKTTRLSFLVPLCAVVLLSFVSGCGSGAPTEDGPPRIPVSGKVSLDGTPIDGGMITFVPKDQNFRPTGGPIENGEYSVPREKGGNAGSYLVQITWPRPTGKKVNDPDTGEMVDVMQESVPKTYNTASTLEVTLSEDNNVHNFELKSK